MISWAPQRLAELRQEFFVENEKNRLPLRTGYLSREGGCQTAGKSGEADGLPGPCSLEGVFEADSSEFGDKLRVRSW